MSKENASDNWAEKEHFFVFSTWDGKPYFHTVPGTWLRRFLKRKKLKPIRFHDLRHTSAALLINQGVHAVTISSRLGHADIRTTMKSQTQEHNFVFYFFRPQSVPKVKNLIL
nr:tyrosine-type recombinase/integrase [Paenibacillus sp. PL91]